MNFAEKKVLVTGASRGIGAAIARQFAEQGAAVAVHYNRNREAAEHTLTTLPGDGHFIVQADIADAQAVQTMIEQVIDRMQHLDILVNNAGITRDTAFHKMTPDQWHAVVETNLTSCFNVTRHVIEGMRERRFGRVINISSVNGQQGQRGQANYSAAKAGMHGFTKALALENANKEITVNTISPGYIATDMVMAVREDIRNKIIATIPKGRLGGTDEIAYLVSYLASEEASFITGANYAINGGQHMS